MQTTMHRRIPTRKDLENFCKGERSAFLIPALSPSTPAMAGHLCRGTLAPSPHWEKAPVSAASTENPCSEAWGERVVLTQRPNALEENTLTGWSLEEKINEGEREITHPVGAHAVVIQLKLLLLVRDAGRPAPGLRCLSRPPMDLWLWANKVPWVTSSFVASQFKSCNPDRIRVTLLREQRPASPAAAESWVLLLPRAFVLKPVT